MFVNEDGSPLSEEELSKLGKKLLQERYEMMQLGLEPIYLESWLMQYFNEQLERYRKAGGVVDRSTNPANVCGAAVEKLASSLELKAEKLEAKLKLKHVMAAAKRELKRVKTAK